MDSSLAATCHTRMPYDLSCAVAISTHLLDHKRSLSDGLEALAATGAARRGCRAWLHFSSVAGAADFGASEAHSTRRAIYSVHEIDLEIATVTEDNKFLYGTARK